MTEDTNALVLRTSFENNIISLSFIKSIILLKCCKRILVYLLLRFLFIYIKRFLVVAILTFMAPILGVTYSIDKIKDNKSQSFTNWLREYTFNVLLQSVHVLLYTVFVSLAFKMAGTSVMGTIMAVLLINFMFKAEVILKKIFGIKSGSIKDAIKSTAVIMGAGKIAKGFMKMNIKATKVVAKPITKPISKRKETKKEIWKLIVLVTFLLLC